MQQEVKPPVVYVAQAPTRDVQLPPEVTQGGPLAIYHGYVRMRDQLRDQLERIEDQREELTTQLSANPVSQANVKGLEARITGLDARIAAIDHQLEMVDAAIAKAATVPGISVDPQPEPEARSGPPEAFIALPGLLILFVLFPLTIAYTRRIWRRSGQVGIGIAQEVNDRLLRMDQNIDAIALEVERIGESQRYLAKQYAERGLGAGAAQPVEVSERDRERHRRG